MQMRAVRAAIAIGSNLGDRAAHINDAIRTLGRLPHTRLVNRAPTLQTAPVGRPGTDPGGEYLNTVVILSTRLPPPMLLQRLFAIERGHGRKRIGVPAWSPRTLDLDLIVYGHHIIRQPGLHVPHPRMHERAFVLEPLAAVAPALLVPQEFGELRTALELLRALQAPSGVQQSC
jgi:2-amino-4-hydroxy-6-hydroxymethyldihydropteridine diphosphokinase